MFPEARGESERTRLACLPNDLHVDRVLGPQKLGVGGKPGEEAIWRLY